MLIQKLEAKYQVQARNDGVPLFMRVLHQILGNKRYLPQIEHCMKESLRNLSEPQNTAFLMLARDLKAQSQAKKQAPQSDLSLLGYK